MIQIIALLTALALDWFAGELPTRFHPVIWMGSWIRFFSGKALARRSGQPSPWPEMLAGTGLILAGIAVFAFPITLLTYWLRPLPEIVQGVLLGLLLKPVFALRSLLRAAEEVQRAVTDSDLPEARRLVAWHLVSRDTSALDAGQVASAVIESVAENLTDSFIAPLMAFCIGGLPLAWAYRLVNTADAMIGYRNEHWEYIGKAAARLDDLLNLIPARITALLIWAGAILCRLDFQKSFVITLRQCRRAASPNAGWTIAAAAGALNAKLEKLNTYCFNETAPDPSGADILRANRLITTAAGLGVLLLILIPLL